MNSKVMAAALMITLFLTALPAGIFLGRLIRPQFQFLSRKKLLLLLAVWVMVATGGIVASYFEHRFFNDGQSPTLLGLFFPPCYLTTMFSITMTQARRKEAVSVKHK